MSSSKHWLPGKREDQLAMVEVWNNVLTEKAAGWGVPTADVNDLRLLTANADDAIVRVNNKATCTPVIRVQCRAAFEELVAKMRYIKKHYFLVPPLTNADLVSLGLRPEDVEPTEIHTPTAQPEGDIAFPGIHLVEIRNIRASAGGIPPDPRSDYGVKIYFGLTGTPQDHNLVFWTNRQLRQNTRRLSFVYLCR